MAEEASSTPAVTEAKEDASPTPAVESKENASATAAVESKENASATAAVESKERASATAADDEVKPADGVDSGNAKPTESGAETQAKTPTDNDPNYFTNADGQKIYRRYWRPVLNEGDTVRALLHICHGLCEHSGWYESIGEALSKQGILVFAHDYVGHGRSDGDRAEVDNFNVYLRDAKQFMDSVKADYPDCPLFLFGYSLGAAIGMLLSIQNADFISGLIAEGPATGHFPLPLAKRMELKVFSLIKPRRAAIKLMPETLLNDPDKIQEYVNDKFTYKGPISAGYMSKVLAAIQDMSNQASKITCPMLLLQGEKDTLSPERGSILFMAKISSADKTLKVYPGANHNVLMETNGQGEEFIQDTLNWILKRTKA